MKFAEWVCTSGLSYAEIARRLGVTEGTTVWRYAAGRRLPSPPHMIRIFLLTGGQVMPNDFYDLPELQQALALPGAAEERRVA